MNIRLTIINIASPPLYFVCSGHILLTVAAIKLAAINGYNWSSYAHDMDVFAYGLDFHDMIANPNLYGTKTYAFPVRLSLPLQY